MAPPHNHGFSASSSSYMPPPSSFSSAPDDGFCALFLSVMGLLVQAIMRRTLTAVAVVASVLATGSRSTGDLLLQAARGSSGGGGGGNKSNSTNDRRRQQPAVRPLLVVANVLLRLLRHNLAPQRVFSLPHFVVAFWVLVLLWGERGTYHASVASCHWDHWEKWPAGATPHHLVLIADPQLIDAHSYPGRLGLINSITMTVTDNFMRRSYRELQEQLRPDTVIFMGDLFDGGREWRPLHGEFAEDAAWSTRPAAEKAYTKMWRKKYDDAYWLREYGRFGDIFLQPETFGGSDPGSDGSADAVGSYSDSSSSERKGRPGGPRGRRLLASLPGNHDLGFGDDVKVSVRDRFQAYFGESNRVDVIGNHSFVSVDTVSFGAVSSEHADEMDTKPIYEPVAAFLEGVGWAKQKAVARELRHQAGRVEEVPMYERRVQELTEASFDLEAQRRALGQVDDARPPADLPTVLLTHVPLFRPPGTPCGPLREHWPPAKPQEDGQPVEPDPRNALPVSRGYQYQTVLNEADSIRLVRSVGNVVHAFSGDDHDYCAVEHDEQHGHVPEITIKAFSMAMSVFTPGFLMVSLYNPIDETGQSLAALSAAAKSGGKPAPLPPTLQTHLCLLPNQLATYARYVGMVAVSLVLMAIYALLVPILNLPVFAFDPDAGDGSSGLPSELLPLYGISSKTSSGGGGGGVGGNVTNKIKVEDDEYGVASRSGGGHGSSAFGPDDAFAGPGGGGSGASDSSGFIAFRPPVASYSRGRNQPSSHHQKPNRYKSSRTRTAAAPRIQIPADDDDDYDDSCDDSSSSNDGGVGGGAGRRFLADNDYMADVYLGSGSGRSNRWRPATHRFGVLRIGTWALGRLQRLVWGGPGDGMRTSISGNSRRRRGGGGGGSGGRAGGVLGQMLRRFYNGGSWTGRRRRGALGGGSGRRRRAPSQHLLSIAAWEFYAMVFRVVWMVVAYWGWLNLQG